MGSFVEVVDNVPVISFCNGITVSKVPLDIVAEGLVKLLDDAGQIPSGFGTWAGCLVVLDKGVAEILPTIDGASRERLELVEGVATHHDREVGSHDVVVVARSSDGDGVDAQPRLGVRLTIILFDHGWLEGGGPLDDPEPTGEGGEAVEVVAAFVVAVWSSRRVVTPAAIVLVVGIGDTMFLVVLAMSLALAVTVVDAQTQILSV